MAAKKRGLISMNLKIKCLLTFHRFSSIQLRMYPRTIYPHKDFLECGRKQKMVSGSHCVLKYQSSHSVSFTKWSSLEMLGRLLSQYGVSGQLKFHLLSCNTVEIVVQWIFFFATFCLVLNKTDCITVREKFKLLLIWVLIYQKIFPGLIFTNQQRNYYTVTIRKSFVHIGIFNFLIEWFLLPSLRKG